MKKLGYKLKNLKVTSVDLCPQGANPDAYIQLCKSSSSLPDDGEVPPAGALSKLLAAIGKLFGKSDAEIESVAKEARLYSTVTANIKNQHVSDEIWAYTYALWESLNSILGDAGIVDRQSMMEQSFSQFSAAVMAAISAWAAGNTVEKTADEPSAEMSNQSLQMQTEEANRQTIKTEKGDITNMELDRSKMTPEDACAFDALAKKYGKKAEAESEQAVSPPAESSAAKSNEPENAELKKALEQLDALNKRIRLGEMEKLAEKYIPLGEKPEELAKTLIAMQDVGESTFNAFIKRLDDSLALVEKSGIFKELGSSRSGSGSSDPLAKIEAAAAELRKANPGLTNEQAFVKACENDPELAREYEQDR